MSPNWRFNGIQQTPPSKDTAGCRHKTICMSYDTRYFSSYNYSNPNRPTDSQAQSREAIITQNGLRRVKIHPEPILAEQAIDKKLKIRVRRINKNSKFTSLPAWEWAQIWTGRPKFPKPRTRFGWRLLWRPLWHGIGSLPALPQWRHNRPPPLRVVPKSGTK